MSALLARLDRWLDAAARRPLLALALLVGVLTLPSLAARDVWANDEVRHADALRGVLSGEHAVVLHLGGMPYGDKPPMWFWIVAGVERATGLPVPSAFFLASALGALAFAAVTWALARRLAGEDRRTSLVAALLALGTPTTVLLAQTTRMDLVFAALIVAAQMALYAAWTRPAPNRWPLVAAVLATLGAGVKGPLALGLPVVSALAWLGWTGRLRRLLCRDVAVAVVWVLAVTAGYGLLVVRAEGEAFVRDLLTNQVWRRAAAAGGHALPFWFYAAVLPVVALPWSIVLVGLPWSRLRSTLSEAYARRHVGAGPGAYLALSAVSGFLLLSALSGKFFIYLAPIIPPLAVLGARALRDMDPAACARGFTSVGLSCLGLAVAVACLPLVLPHLPLVGSWPIEVRGLLPLAGALAATALAVLAVRKAPGLTVAAVTALGLVLSLAVAARFVAGSLDPVMSPRASAEEIRSYADRGYVPLVFRTYPGVYAWHAGGPLPETNDVAALERHVATPGPVVVAMPRKYWDRHQALLTSLHVVSERWIAGETLHVVAVRDAVPPTPTGEPSPHR